MQKTAIRKGQIWEHKKSHKKVRIVQKQHGDKWAIMLLETELGNTSDCHRVAPQTLWTKFILIP